MTDAVRQQVLAIYAEVEAAVVAAGPRCEASGRCCRFTEYGHTLFLSQFEAEILLEAAPPYEKPVTRDRCPFQIENLCTAREPRPIGCRVYFCDPTYTETGNAITEAAIAKLKRLADEHDTGWSYAPLHVFLNNADRPTPPMQDKMMPGEGDPTARRVALPIV